MTSQVRKHTKIKLIHRIRYLYHKSRLGYCGSNVYIDKNVALMRFPKNIKIGQNVILKEGAKICACNEQSSITIGENTTIGYQSFIFASEAISIGNNCLIAPFVYIVDSDHNIEKSMLINEQGNLTEKVSIQDDVWVGAGAKILKGVTLAKGCIVAAGAIVNQSTDEYFIYGGIPAKKIGERK